LFVSHNMAAIENLCKKVILLQNGKLFIEGETKIVISAYLKEFLGSNLTTLRDCPRRGNGKLQVISFHLETSDGLDKKQVKSGDMVAFVFGYKNFLLKTDDKVSFSFGVHDESGKGLFHYYSHFSNKYFRNLPKHGYVKCIIPELLLSPGTYYVSCRVISNGDLQTGEELDWPQVNIPFTVVDGDFYNTGSYQLSRWGPILVKGKWEIIKNENP